MQIARAALRLGLILLLVSAAIGRAGAVEAQKSDPGQCEADDKACIEAWYKEYSAGLLDEFKYYSGQEDFLAEMQADPQATLLTAKLSLLLVEGGTKYSQWTLLDDEPAVKGAGLDMARYRAIIGPCREAISDMRTALFDLRDQRDKSHAEAVQYLKNAVACEKAFGLPARLSKLRGKPQPPATSGPMEIAPQKPRR
jgi:hypothetical protein